MTDDIIWYYMRQHKEIEMDTIIEMTLPTHWLTAIFNDDRTGFNDEDEQQYNSWIKDMNTDNFDWHELDCEQEPHFATYHDAKRYGVLACDVVRVTFAAAPTNREEE